MSDPQRGQMAGGTARGDFDRARFKSFWRDVLSYLTQADNTLLPYDEVRAQLPMRGQSYLGIKEVPLDQIVGSVSRYGDFDRAFLPRQTHTRDRWMSIDRAHLQDIILPPVELYKIGEAYFVKDGNHRVSVARERGQVYIDAVVIEVAVPVPIGPETNLRDLVLKREAADFLNRTHLDELRPGSQVELTLPGQYDTLLEHIEVHRYFLGLQRGEEVDYAEAVTSWYENVYMPLVEMIRERGILREFSGRTETDLYLWIIEHSWYLRENFRDDFSLDQAADHFLEEFSQNPRKRLGRAFKHFFQTLKESIQEAVKKQ